MYVRLFLSYVEFLRRQACFIYATARDWLMWGPLCGPVPALVWLTKLASIWEKYLHIKQDNHIINSNVDIILSVLLWKKKYHKCTIWWIQIITASFSACLWGSTAASLRATLIHTARWTLQFHARHCFIRQFRRSGPVENKGPKKQ